MRIYVCIKQVPDTETKIKLKADASGIDETGIKWIMNPYDEYAVEEALKIKLDRADHTVTVVSVGPKRRVVDSLRTAMAMGADDGVVVDCESPLDPYLTAKALTAALKKEGMPDLVLTGKLAIDDNAGSVSQYLAEFLNLPHVTVVSSLSFDGTAYTAEREVEGGTKEIYKVTGPAVIAANKGLNTPRYASLPGIMKAKKKPLKEMSLADVGLDASLCKTTFTNFELPPEKPPVQFIEGDATRQAQELVRKLREEAKVL